jgi:hypothetical protein
MIVDKRNARLLPLMIWVEVLLAVDVCFFFFLQRGG